MGENEAAQTANPSMPSDPSSPPSGNADASAGVVASSDGGTTPTSTDPFDPASCTGPTITRADVAQRFQAGATTAPVGKYTVYYRSRTCDSLTGCGPWAATTVYATGTATFVANSAADRFDLIIDDDRNDPRCLGHEPTDRSGMGGPYGTYDLQSFRFEDVTAESTEAILDVLEWASIACLYADHCIYGCTTANAEYGGLENTVVTGRATNTCLRATNERKDSQGNVIGEMVLAMPL
jgi:hypothetical protein